MVEHANEAQCSWSDWPMENDRRPQHDDGTIHKREPPRSLRTARGIPIRLNSNNASQNELRQTQRKKPESCNGMSTQRNVFTSVFQSTCRWISGALASEWDMGTSDGRGDLDTTTCVPLKKKGEQTAHAHDNHCQVSRHDRMQLGCDVQQQNKTRAA